jgi:hypothetical protein
MQGIGEQTKERGRKKIMRNPDKGREETCIERDERNVKGKERLEEMWQRCHMPAAATAQLT